MRRLAILAGILVVLLGALWEVPRRLDWAAWRADLAWIATQRLGRIVYLSGPVRLTLLPQPVIEAEGVELGGAEGDLSLKAQALRLRLGWRALLTGRLEPREVALVGADLRLPWPPAPSFSLRPPSWMTALEARIEQGRISLGPVTLEGVTGTITTGGPTEALLARGRFTWRGQAMNFDANIGRPGLTMAAPMELNLRQGDTSLNANGALLPEGGYEGQIALAGNDLSLLLPAPARPFRAQGRLSVSADLLSADELNIDLGGHPAKGAATLRLQPVPRLDVALAASRLDLDAWVAALRRSGNRTLPLGLDLSSDMADFAGVQLRRLRGSVMLTSGKAVISDASAMLPGGTELTLSGEATGNMQPASPANAAAGAPAGPVTGGTATTGPVATAPVAAGQTGPNTERLSLDLHLAGDDLRGTLAAFGLPLTGIDPARLRQGEARLKLVATPGQVAFSDLNAEIDGTRLSGTGTLRLGARPALGVGLTLDKLDLARLRPVGLDRAGVFSFLNGFDANIRLAADSLNWGDTALTGATVDAALDTGRIALRRLAGTIGGAQVVMTGGAQMPAGNNPLRLSDVALEATAPMAEGLLALLPAEWTGKLKAFQPAPLTLRLNGNGPLEALQGRASLDLGSLRAELQGTGDVVARKGNVTLSLRHPGLPRLLGETLGAGTGDWLGEGSLALIAPLSVTPQGASTEYLDLVAASMRIGGALSLSWDGPRPKFTGRLRAETLPLPGWRWKSDDPLPIAALRQADLDIALSANRLDMPGLPLIDDASATLRVVDGALTLADGKGRLAGGTLGLTGSVTPGADVPRLQLGLTLADLGVEAPLLGLPLDLTAGKVSGTLALGASGFSPAAMLSSLSGDVKLGVSGGALRGIDLSALAEASRQPDVTAVEAGMRTALGGGSTGFTQLDLASRIDQGRAALTGTKMTLTGGQTAEAVGEVDLPRGTLDLRLGTRLGEGPELALRLTGPIAAPRRLPELSPWLLWHAAR